MRKKEKSQGREKNKKCDMHERGCRRGEYTRFQMVYKEK
jgi:hypothetical protein